MASPLSSPTLLKKRKAPVELGTSLLTKKTKVSAQREYYGIDIHRLLGDAEAEERVPKSLSLPTPPAEQKRTSPRNKSDGLLWTEKYRARKFTDLIGDERTHRSVMQWLKKWDPIVFPGSSRPKPAKDKTKEDIEEKPFRKILMLAGPPGLGKTTLAHVCAKQAGYEVQEINASDERTAAVVKGRIKDMVGTENVRGANINTASGKVRKAGKPVCVVIDEADGVVAGGGGAGEGGFIKALIDLVVLDQKNSSGVGKSSKKKGDRFRLLRPLILVLNDVYHPSLRALRQSSHAEIVHMRKPPLQTVASRMQSIFAREGVPCESDGVRRLCEATWGVSGRREDRGGNGAGEGDIRGIMVVGEWVAAKVRAMRESTGEDIRLTRKWVEENVLHDLSDDGGAARGLGRGNLKDIVDRVFREGASFPQSTASDISQDSPHFGPRGVAEGRKRIALIRLRQLVDTHGDTDRIVTDCFTAYPDHPFQDDTFLSKPNLAYEWLHFHDHLSSAVYGSHEWELAPYLSSPVLAFHHLFATPTRAQYARAEPTAVDDSGQGKPKHAFLGPQASWAAHESTKHHESLLHSLQSKLPLHLARSFTSPSIISSDLLPYLIRMLSPSINPVVVGGSNSKSSTGPSTASVRKSSEQKLVARSITAMAASGVRFERLRVTSDEDPNGRLSWQSNNSQWIYRMDPAIDELVLYETGGKPFSGAMNKQRYAVRQVLEQEWKKEEARKNEAARLARGGGASHFPVRIGAVKPAEKVVGKAVKRDFFGRPVVVSCDEGRARKSDKKGDGPRVWITYHEGYSNAVRKPITLREIMRDL
ncbi:P-loop containing nucleoside triphosphate hydrolase protein [Piedraia hortae CBS 480.64]|uniref:P-loop containing nucleoside triphosphate hydrolase protein n=1 Tax=Piedraia hortae CBS 480.64 TaxID=1314780 RepID=A0A6A7C4F5_9PEZI|nr:P-loop containing nucleoside triphosphate hydrolase protein [Piedraia hortae CBS 480.64]